MPVQADSRLSTGARVRLDMYLLRKRAMAPGLARIWEFCAAPYARVSRPARHSWRGPGQVARRGSGSSAGSVQRMCAVLGYALAGLPVAAGGGAGRLTTSSGLCDGLADRGQSAMHRRRWLVGRPSLAGPGRGWSWCVQAVLLAVRWLDSRAGAVRIGAVPPILAGLALMRRGCFNASIGAVARSVLVVDDHPGFRARARALLVAAGCEAGPHAAGGGDR